MNAIVRTDRMLATNNCSGLVSVRYKPDGVEKKIDNGNIVKISTLENGYREIYKGVIPLANDKIHNIVLVASPEVLYDEHKHNLDEFYNEAGDILRGYHLYTNDIFSVTKEALEGKETPEVGNIVELKNGTKLNVVTSATTNSTVVWYY